MTTPHSTSPQAQHIVPVSHHGPLTRLVHGGLAIAVIVQLGSSQIMVPAEPGRTPNTAFEVHEYAGLVAFAAILLFWAVIALRRKGTPAGLMFPWFNGAAMRALWADTTTHVRVILRRKLPAYDARSPLASAVHGLGLLAISMMAVTGAIYWGMGIENPDAGGVTSLLMTLHELFANLAWAYLVGHAAVGVLYHFASSMRLGTMWSLPRSSELRK